MTLCKWTKDNMSEQINGCPISLGLLVEMSVSTKVPPKIKDHTEFISLSVSSTMVSDSWGHLINVFGRDEWMTQVTGLIV